MTLIGLLHTTHPWLDAILLDHAPGVPTIFSVVILAKVHSDTPWGHLRHVLQTMCLDRRTSNHRSKTSEFDLRSEESFGILSICLRGPNRDQNCTVWTQLNKSQMFFWGFFWSFFSCSCVFVCMCVCVACFLSLKIFCCFTQVHRTKQTFFTMAHHSLSARMYSYCLQS